MPTLNYSHHFADRIEAIERGVAYFGITPTYRAELFAADETVNSVVRATFEALSLPTDDDIDAVAAQLVKGKLKPATACEKLKTIDVPTHDGKTIAQKLLSRVRAHANAAYADKRFSTDALRADVREQISNIIEDDGAIMVDAVHNAPKHVVAQLTREVNTLHGFSYGHDVREALSWLGNDLATVRGDDLDATRELITSWRFATDGSPALIDALYYAATGKTSTPDDRHFSEPALLFFGGDNVDYLAAGVWPTYPVAVGLGDDLQPIGDPFGADADELTRRISRYRAFKSWLNEYLELRSVGANPAPDLKRRSLLDMFDQIEQFREHYDSKAA